MGFLAAVYKIISSEKSINMCKIVVNDKLIFQPLCSFSTNKLMRIKINNSVEKVRLAFRVLETFLLSVNLCSFSATIMRKKS
ncbi:hypothetical protein C4F51_15395 [Cellvibrio sp. KB43]|uniref:Uncharacterized protein n=1 Tax=Cellvibrio polysaccharolyticus TaxID=2082724 RepID=A0A928V5C8_9GAMM|nr:hypothetical protein [Cellvibrio polysaccharolyticus]